MAAALERVLELTDADASSAASTLPAATAEPLAQRFAAVLAAREPLGSSGAGGATKAGASSTVALTSSLVPGGVPEPLLVTDPVTAAFWRYCRARGSARTALLGRKLTR